MALSMTVENNSIMCLKLSLRHFCIFMTRCYNTDWVLPPETLRQRSAKLFFMKYLFYVTIFNTRSPLICIKLVNCIFNTGQFENELVPAWHTCNTCAFWWTQPLEAKWQHSFCQLHTVHIVNDAIRTAISAYPVL